MTDNADILRRFMERVWNSGDSDAVDEFLAAQYTIHSDPGDPWDGQTLSPDGFKQRLQLSRAPFPDLRFELIDVIPDGERVAISWTMYGTQTAAMGERPPSGRSIAVQGMTVYYFDVGRITGHRQVVDRLTAARQLGLMG